MNVPEELQPALDKLEERLAAIDTGPKLAELLAQTRSMWRYSANNAMMLVEQAALRETPLAGQVAGFKAWQRVGRSVRRGEKAYRILAPMRRTVWSGVDQQGEHVLASRREDLPGNVENIESRTVASRFKAAAVFDLNQTDGPELDDGRVKLALGNPEETWKKLVRFAEGQDLTVRTDPTHYGSSHGHYSPTKREIVVGEFLSPSDRCATLAHEIAHATLAHDDVDELKERYPGIPSRAIAEVEAEAAGFIIMAGHGHDTTERAAEYLAGWTDAARAHTDTDERVDTLRAVLGRSHAAAKTVLEVTDPPTHGGTIPATRPTLEADMKRLEKDAATAPSVRPHDPQAQPAATI